jgi:hypothetical protein
MFCSFSRFDEIDDEEQESYDSEYDSDLRSERD